MLEHKFLFRTYCCPSYSVQLPPTENYVYLIYANFGGCDACTYFLSIYQFNKKGEVLTSKRLCEKYRISFGVSDREWDDFEGQISDTVSFLEKYYAQIQELFATHSVIDAFWDFPLWSRLGENIVNQNAFDY